MDFLAFVNQQLVLMLGPLGPVILAAVVAVFVGLMFVPAILKRQQDPLEKLRQANVAKTGKTQTGLRQSKSSDKLDKYANFLEPQDQEELSAMRAKLLQAGYRDRDSVRYFYFAQMLLGLGGLGLGVSYYMFILGPDNASTQQMMMWILGPGGAGYFVPRYWITRRIEARKEEITRGFPDALDMMLVCVEAGQSMDQAIIRVSHELQASYPALADEFEIVSHEMKAGKDKSTVLNDMSERAGVQDVSSFVTVLIQSQTFGTSISDALRVYAEEMRDKRVMRAEEAANKLPTKMTLTTMMLTVPPLLIILIGPSAVSIGQLGQLAGN